MESLPDAPQCGALLCSFPSCHVKKSFQNPETSKLGLVPTTPKLSFLYWDTKCLWTQQGREAKQMGGQSTRLVPSEQLWWPRQRNRGSTNSSHSDPAEVWESAWHGTDVQQHYINMHTTYKHPLDKEHMQNAMHFTRLHCLSFFSWYLLQAPRSEHGGRTR